MYPTLAVAEGECQSQKLSLGAREVVKKDSQSKSVRIQNRWSPQEVEKLESLVMRHGENWKVIGAQMEPRTAFLCRQKHIQQKTRQSSWASMESKLGAE